jgi:hypothetical protein
MIEFTDIELSTALGRTASLIVTGAIEATSILSSDVLESTASLKRTHGIRATSILASGILKSPLCAPSRFLEDAMSAVFVSTDSRESVSLHRSPIFSRSQIAHSSAVAPTAALTAITTVHPTRRFLDSHLAGATASLPAFMSSKLDTDTPQPLFFATTTSTDRSSASSSKTVLVIAGSLASLLLLVAALLFLLFWRRSQSPSSFEDESMEEEELPLAEDDNNGNWDPFEGHEFRNTLSSDNSWGRFSSQYEFSVTDSEPEEAHAN